MTAVAVCPLSAPAPVRLQVTPLVMGSFETVAVTFVVFPCSSVCAVLGVRAIETACKLIVSVMLLVVSATDVAVIVTVAFAAIGEGAVYVTEVVVCPLSAPRPVKLQVTPLLDLSFATVAVIVTVWPATADCVPLGERLMVTGLDPPLQPATRHREQTHNAHIKRERVLFMTASLAINFLVDGRALGR